MAEDIRGEFTMIEFREWVQSALDDGEDVVELHPQFVLNMLDALSIALGGCMVIAESEGTEDDEWAEYARETATISTMKLSGQSAKAINDKIGEVIYRFKSQKN